MSDMAAPKTGNSTTSLDDLFTLGSGAPEAPIVKQTISDILLNGEEPTEEFLEEFIVLSEVPPLSDEEFERQALSAPGDDEDPSTPEKFHNTLVPGK
ncbi:MAG: hypothetical protein JNM42_01160 [Propionivibrio sp.]|uniref:hypothetical protein n=1 Tax=Propionivibrio sp. TaxID=2212460 RepID=UPI001A5E9C6A|nr:hypothetical protein [Propionivibrio sp.]MBL8413029.1 hypothetical protein [Propionivibrio sp.]